MKKLIFAFLFFASTVYGYSFETTNISTPNLATMVNAIVSSNYGPIIGQFEDLSDENAINPAIFDLVYLSSPCTVDTADAPGQTQSKYAKYRVSVSQSHVVTIQKGAEANSSEAAVAPSTPSGDIALSIFEVYVQ
jgi:hypothetical protein